MCLKNLLLRTTAPEKPSFTQKLVYKSLNCKYRDLRIKTGTPGGVQKFDIRIRREKKIFSRANASEIPIFTLKFVYLVKIF